MRRWNKRTADAIGDAFAAGRAQADGAQRRLMKVRLEDLANAADREADTEEKPDSEETDASFGRVLVARRSARALRILAITLGR